MIGKTNRGIGMEEKDATEGEYHKGRLYTVRRRRKKRKKKRKRRKVKRQEEEAVERKNIQQRRW